MVPHYIKYAPNVKLRLLCFVVPQIAIDPASLAGPQICLSRSITVSFRYLTSIDRSLELAEKLS